MKWEAAVGTRVVGEGTALGERYRLVERIAWGGMGEVWKAHDEHIERDVAVKMLRDDLAADPAAVERFRREARMAASFSHPNVAAVYDVVNGGQPAIVMELVRGETLATSLRKGPMSITGASRVADGLLAALEAAHASGIVHRDVTPGNVLLSDDGGIKVTDFGIARAEQEHQTRLTDTGTVIGTAHYLAPEQLEDAPPTAATDQYAAALVIYEALTASLPFEGTNPAAIALARLQTVPIPLVERRPDVPAPLAAVVMRGLERDPADRFASMSDMRAAFAAAARSGAATNGPATAAVATAVATLPATSGGTAPMPVRAGRTQRQKAAAAPPLTPPTARRRAGTATKGALILLAIALSVLLTGWAVARSVKGTAVVSMPSFTGMPIAAAEEAAEDLGLRIQKDIVDAPEPEGTVVSQTIAPQVRIEAGNLVGLHVSSGVPPCCTVPTLIGTTDDRALVRSTVEGAGLTLRSWDEREDPQPLGTILEQSPAPGSTVDPGTPLDVVVSSGPPQEEDDGERRGKGKHDDD